MYRSMADPPACPPPRIPALLQARQVFSIYNLGSDKPGLTGLLVGGVGRGEQADRFVVSDGMGRHGMDACTRCGEAIPVVWARNIGDADEHPHFTQLTLAHTKTHTSHVTQRRSTQHQRPGRAPCYCTIARPERRPSITTSATNHHPPSPLRRQPASAPATWSHCHERWRLHDDIVLLETDADPVHLMTASRE
jgi:hypothetical protein